MFALDIGSNWASQISAIRDANSEDTNLIRFDNTYYRVSKSDSGTFTVMLRGGSKPVGPGLALVFQARDLYVTHIAGRPFGRYASTVDRLTRSASGIESAVLEIHRAQGTELFEMQSLIVLCVAESLRSDYAATLVGQTIRATTTGLLGAPMRLPTAELLRIARAWGQTSDAILGAVSPQRRDVVVRPRAVHSAEQRQASERVDLTKIDPALRDFAKKVKVLKRPA